MATFEQGDHHARPWLRDGVRANCRSMADKQRLSAFAASLPDSIFMVNRRSRFTAGLDMEIADIDPDAITDQRYRNNWHRM